MRHGYSAQRAAVHACVTKARFMNAAGQRARMAVLRARGAMPPTACTSCSRFKRAARSCHERVREERPGTLPQNGEAERRVIPCAV